MRSLALACLFVRGLGAQTFTPPQVLELALPEAKTARDGALWMQPYRTLVADLEKISKPREERRLRVLLLRRRE